MALVDGLYFTRCAHWSRDSVLLLVRPSFSVRCQRHCRSEISSKRIWPPRVLQQFPHRVRPCSNPFPQQLLPLVLLLLQWRLGTPMRSAGTSWTNTTSGKSISAPGKCWRLCRHRSGMLSLDEDTSYAGTDDTKHGVCVPLTAGRPSL